MISYGDEQGILCHTTVIKALVSQWCSMAAAMAPFCCLFSCVVSRAFAVVFILLLKEGAEASVAQEPQWLNLSSESVIV